MTDSTGLYEHDYIQPGHFSFGENWKQYLRTVSEEKIHQAQVSLEKFLGPGIVRGKVFYDVGSGSGIFSLAAVRLGASKVVSIDADANSVEATCQTKSTHAPEASHWTIDEGSILNDMGIQTLGKAEIVYSWGVLHHTGDMWKAIRNTSDLVQSGGWLYIALYNKSHSFTEGSSLFWVRVKRLYNRVPKIVKNGINFLYSSYLVLGLTLKGRNPVTYIRSYSSARGMDFFSDIRDWLGGYPYEYATVEEVIAWLKPLGFEIQKTRQARSIGCNEYLFRKK